MQKQTAEINEVEPSQRRRVEVVHTQLVPLDFGAKGLTRELETGPLALTARDLGNGVGSRVRGPLPRVRIVEVDGNDFSCASALHLERPETVERSDVEAPL